MKPRRSTPLRRFAWLLSLSTLSLGAASPSTEGQWNLIPAITDRQLNAVTGGQGLFVAVGQDGTVLTSPNGSTWNLGSVGANTWLLGVGFGTNTFVAVGYSGTVYTSTNAFTWSAVSSGTTNLLFDVTYANNLFVVVGSGGTILTSPDGTNWTLRISGTTAQLGGVAFGNDRFLAAGSDGTLISSIDGTNWVSAGTNADSTWLFDVAFGTGTFVTVGDSGSIYTLPPATSSWAKPDAGVSVYLSGATFSASGFVVVGQGGTILTSVDGLVWAPAESPTQNWLLSATSVDQTVIAVGTVGTIVMAQTRASTPIELVDPQILSRGEFRCQIRGLAVGQLVTLWATDDLNASGAQWTLVAQLVADAPSIPATDYFAARHTRRFYRVIAQ